MPFNQKLTNTFLVTDSTTVFPVSQNGLERWEKDYASDMKRLGNTYIFTNVATFVQAVYELLGGDGPAGYWDGITGEINTSFADLGKDLFFGTSTESNLIHARLIQMPESSANSGKDGYVGYIPIEINCSDFVFPNDIYVGVARV